MEYISKLIDFARWPLDLEAREFQSRLRPIHQQIVNAQSKRASDNMTASPVTLVAVSKRQSVTRIHTAYKVGLRAFGENNVDEIAEKAPLLPNDIVWHFVGHLQSRKAQRLVRSVPQLALIHSVDSKRLAERLNKAAEERLQSHPEYGKLKILLQVNVNQDPQKHGIPPTVDDVIAFAEILKKTCPNLEIKGLMSIGSQAGSLQEEDIKGEFAHLRFLRDELAKHMSVPSEQLELSMGMSADFPQAIHQGATMVRVGTSLFGPRSAHDGKKNVDAVVSDVERNEQLPLPTHEPMTIVATNVPKYGADATPSHSSEEISHTKGNTGMHYTAVCAAAALVVFPLAVSVVFIRTAKKPRRLKLQPGSSAANWDYLA